MQREVWRLTRGARFAQGILYMCTKEERYLDWTLRMADWYLQKQEDDGHWEQSLSAAGLVALPGCPYAAETERCSDRHELATAQLSC